MKIINLIGPPGSGKGTQAKLLADKFFLEYVGSGDVLRKRQKVNDFTGKKLKETMNKGELVPSFVVIKILGDKLEKLKKKKNIKGFVLDGWTRTIYESILMDESLEWYAWADKVKFVLIKISNKESFNRLTKRRQCKKCGNLIPWLGEFKRIKKCDKCGGELIVRSDDEIKGIKKRLEEYNKETAQAIRYYKKQKRLIEVNGEQSIERVFDEMVGKLSVRD
ncbi:MAG: nucleoside monophosphate kinase [Candidatus Pacebacteria bacterium]|nr:nucleoside monophosphate kinase [Candidatus Paceibacterota bacterium]